MVGGRCSLTHASSSSPSENLLGAEDEEKAEEDEDQPSSKGTVCMLNLLLYSFTTLFLL